MSVCVIGTGHTKFGRLPQSLYELLIKAEKEALENAKINPKDIGGIWVSNYGSLDFNNQGHMGQVGLEIDENLRFAQCVRVENACASGSSAAQESITAIESGRVKFALVIDTEK